jgi:phosphatidylglycerophosphate synthase
MTKNTFYVKIHASSLQEKGRHLSVVTLVRSSVSGVNNFSRSGFEVLAKPAVKILRPHNNWWAVRNLANIISTIRLPLSLVVVIGWVYPAYVNQDLQSLYIALVVMLLILLSDGFDGALARGLDSVSRYGKAVDPVADKVFYIAMTVSLVVGATRIVPQQIVIVMAVCLVPAVYYEVRLVSIAIVTDRECRKRHSAEPVGANMWGKAKFALQASAGFAGFGLPWATAGFSLAMCLVVLSLPMAHMSLRGHQLDLEAIKAKPVI